MHLISSIIASVDFSEINYAYINKIEINDNKLLT